MCLQYQERCMISVYCHCSKCGYWQLGRSHKMVKILFALAGFISVQPLCQHKLYDHMYTGIGRKTLWPCCVLIGYTAKVEIHLLNVNRYLTVTTWHAKIMQQSKGGLNWCSLIRFCSRPLEIPIIYRQSHIDNIGILDIFYLNTTVMIIGFLIIL